MSEPKLDKVAADTFRKVLGFVKDWRPGDTQPHDMGEITIYENTPDGRLAIVEQYLAPAPNQDE